MLTAQRGLKFLKGAVLKTAVAAHYYCAQIDCILFVLLVTNGVTSEGRINLQTNDMKKIWLTKQRLICWKCNFQDGEAPVEIVFVLAATFYLLCDLLELFLLGQNIHMVEHASLIINITKPKARPSRIVGPRYRSNGYLLEHRHGTTNNHKNRPGTMKYPPRTMKNRPRTKITNLEP